VGTPQTITFGALNDVAVGAAPFTVTATASSGLGRDLLLDPPLRSYISGNTSRFLRAGSCSITANQVGNATYATAAPVTQSFNVGPVSQTIAFGALSDVTYGVAPFTITATRVPV